MRTVSEFGLYIKIDLTLVYHIHTHHMLVAVINNNC